MSDMITYTMKYDKTISTRLRDGVIEHKHAGYEYWHPASIKHSGCGRMECGVGHDIRTCGGCDCVGNSSECHGRRRELGLNKAYVVHGTNIDMDDAMMMIDEVVSDLISAKSMINSVGAGSDCVHQARFEQFARTIDGIVDDLLKISMYTEEEMEAER